jgi:hypothetical protein
MSNMISYFLNLYIAQIPTRACSSILLGLDFLVYIVKHVFGMTVKMSTKTRVQMKCGMNENHAIGSLAFKMNRFL